MGLPFYELGRFGLLNDADEFVRKGFGVTSFERLYNDGKDVSVFHNSEVSKKDSNFNVNALEATEMITRVVREAMSYEAGGVGVVTGSMAASKTSVGVLLTREFENIQFFQHTADRQRFDTHLVTTQAAGGWQSGVEGNGYASITDLMDEDGIKFGRGEIVFVDEFGFIGDGNPPKMKENEFLELTGRARDTNTILVLSLLDLDFATRPWPNMKLANGNLDLFRVVLAGRCADDCGKPSFLTQRNVILEDGRVRPSHWGEPVFQVGSVVTNTYQSKCFDHHRVLSPKEAAKFDSGG